MSQKTRVLNYLAHNDGLSSLIATRLDPPIMRLASRVHELRADGWNIPGETVKSGTGATYTIYHFSALDAERYAGGNL